MNLLVATTATSNNLEWLPPLIILSIIIIFCIVMIAKTSGAKKRAKKARINLMESRNASLFSTFAHTNGLPIPENTFCNVLSCPEQIEIHASGSQFDLVKNKINDMCIKTNVDIQKQYTSSAGGAVAGALMFGAVGALIGGRTKQKNIRKIQSYLIVTYQKDDTVDYIAFDVTNNIASANKFIKEFNNRESSTKNIIKL